MPRKEEFRVYLLGYKNDPEEERLRLSTLDYLAACTYNNYALFFKLNEEDTSKTAAVLKEGLERTLSQCRHLVGTIEKNEDGDHSFVKKRDSTVTEGLVMIYPPRNTPNPDEGCEFVISVEKELVKQVVEDPELKKYFEFRGIDAEEAVIPPIGFGGKLQ